MIITKETLDAYIERFKAAVIETAAKEKWRRSELAMTLATAEDVVRQILKGRGHKLPRRRRAT